MRTNNQNISISKALIVADPWIGFLLDGSKTWEMRSTATAHRGWFGLIRKGSGAIQAVARLVEVGEPLSPAGMIETFERHRIPTGMIHSGEVAKWNTPWKLADIHVLKVPVPYRHKSGAVTWVSLEDTASNEVNGQVQMVSSATLETTAQDRQPSTAPRAPKTAKTLPPSVASTQSANDRKAAMPDGSRLIGEIEINEANLRNNHFYLRPLVHKFPDQVIGGSNKSKAAKHEVLIDWGDPVPTSTDIDGEDKKFFRARGWVGAFFKLNQAVPGDVVMISQTGPYRYRVRLKKRG